MNLLIKIKIWWKKDQLTRLARKRSYYSYRGFDVEPIQQMEARISRDVANLERQLQ